MNVFDKACAVIAFALGVIFLLGGTIGLFIGCRAWFSLPPVIGILPAFAGWGIVRAVYLAWSVQRVKADGRPAPLQPADRMSPSEPPIEIRTPQP